MIRIGQTASAFEKDQQYSEVVKSLKNKGFTNIRVQRANDIWPLPLQPTEGTIKKITINGSDKFSEDDLFTFDSEIIIIVHTRNWAGCEDITEIAK